MQKNNSEYILGTSDEELDRLGYQHQVWLDEAAGLWTEANFGLGDAILDVGAGPGFVALDLARLVGANGRIAAVDNSEKFVAYLRQQTTAAGLKNVTAEIADVHSLEFADGSFDGAFARWLLCFVAEPETVVAEVARVLKPGGRFVVMDYYNYLAVKVSPRRASIERLFAAYYESVRRQGGSYDIAARLPEIMNQSGFEVTFIKPICRVARAGSRVWRWVESFHHSFIPKLVEGGLLTEKETDEFWRDWMELENDSAAFFFTPPMLGIVARKNN